MLSLMQHIRPSFTEYTSPLSIMCVFKGQVQCQVDGKRVLIDQDSYLIVNASQSVVSSIERASKSETLAVAFQSSFVEEAFATMITPDDKLLDNRTKQPIYFFDKSYAHDGAVTPVLNRLKRVTFHNNTSQAWFEEQLYLLFEGMLFIHRNIRREINSLPAVRLATRVEIYRRIDRARDFIKACYNENLTLSQMAEQAFLSPYHFLRLFKQIFHETPYQYLTRERLNRARTLVLETDKSIAEICADIGFQSLGSFSWLFRRHFNVSPSKLRS